MKRFFYLPLLMLIVLMASCSKSVPNYTRLIPEDADVVVRLDIRQMSKKSGFGKNDVLKNKIKEFIKSEFSGKAKEKILAILDDPKQAGLDLRYPVFFYGSSDADNSIGLVGAVWDADDFTDLLNVMAQEAGIEKVTTGELNYLKMFDMLVCYNNDWFFVAPYNTDLDNAKAQAGEIAKRYEKAEKSMADNEGFRQMCMKKGLMQVFVKGEAMGSVVDNMMSYYNPEYTILEEDTVEVEEAVVDYDEIPEAVEEPSIDNPSNDLPEAPEVAEGEDIMMDETEPWDYDENKQPSREMAKKMGFELESVGMIFEFSMKRGEAAISAEMVAVKDDAKKALKELDKDLGGKQDGFCFRLNFGMLKQLVNISEDMDSDDAMIMRMVANFVKYIELKYEGNCMLTLRMKTFDQDKTPLQSIVDLAMNYLQYL